MSNAFMIMGLTVSVPSRGGQVYIKMIMSDLRTCQRQLPSPREVDRFISDYKEAQDSILKQFSSPLEVDRFMSKQNRLILYSRLCFRPLSRYIGLYHARIEISGALRQQVTVPSRGGQGYIERTTMEDKKIILFPSPREVHRFISRTNKLWLSSPTVTVPSRGEQVYIEDGRDITNCAYDGFRPLSR